MGNSSNVLQKFSNSSNQQYIQIDPTQNAQLVQVHQNYKLYKNSRSQLFQKYIVKQFNYNKQQQISSQGNDEGNNNSKSSFQQSYHYRLTHRCRQFVQLLYANQVEKGFDCTFKEDVEYQVVTERIKYRLNQLFNISFSNALVILKVSLKGFKNLFKYNGLFWPKDTMIGINFYDQVKVWLNPNFSLNYTQSIPLSLKSLPIQDQQDMIVNNLFDMISSKTFPSLEWKQLMKLRISKINQRVQGFKQNQPVISRKMSFQLAQQIIYEIASKYGIQNLKQNNRIYDLFNERQNMILQNHQIIMRNQSNKSLNKTDLINNQNQINGTNKNVTHQNILNINEKTPAKFYQSQSSLHVTFVNPFTDMNNSIKKLPQMTSFTNTLQNQIVQPGRAEFIHSQYQQISSNKSPIVQYQTVNPVVKQKSFGKSYRPSLDKNQKVIIQNNAIYSNQNVQTNGPYNNSYPQKRQVYPKSLKNIKSHIMGNHPQNYKPIQNNQITSNNLRNQQIIQNKNVNQIQAQKTNRNNATSPIIQFQKNFPQSQEDINIKTNVINSNSSLIKHQTPNKETHYQNKLKYDSYLANQVPIPQNYQYNEKSLSKYVVIHNSKPPIVMRQNHHFANPLSMNMNPLKNNSKVTFSQPKSIQNHSFNIHPQNFHNRPLNSQSIKKNETSNRSNSNSKIKIKFNNRDYQGNGQNNYQIVSHSNNTSINPKFSNSHLQVPAGFNNNFNQSQNTDVVKNSSNPQINSPHFNKQVSESPNKYQISPQKHQISPNKHQIYKETPNNSNPQINVSNLWSQLQQGLKSKFQPPQVQTSNSSQNIQNPFTNIPQQNNQGQGFNNLIQSAFMQSQNQNQVVNSDQFNNGFFNLPQQIISSCFQSNLMPPMMYDNSQYSQQGMIYNNQPQQEHSAIPIENMFDTSSSNSNKNIFESYKDSSNENMNKKKSSKQLLVQGSFSKENTQSNKQIKIGMINSKSQQSIKSSINYFQPIQQKQMNTKIQQTQNGNNQNEERQLYNFKLKSIKGSQNYIQEQNVIVSPQKNNQTSNKSLPYVQMSNKSSHQKIDHVEQYKINQISVDNIRQSQVKSSQLLRSSQCKSQSQTIINKLNKWQKRNSQTGVQFSDNGFKRKQQKLFSFNKIQINNQMKPPSAITYKDLRKLLTISSTTNQESDQQGNY